MSREAKIAIAYGLIIISISSIPGRNFPDINLWTKDKLSHLIEFMIFAVLVHRALGIEFNHSGYSLALTLFIGACFGGLDELYQSLIPGRDSSLYDWYADSIGVALGAIAALVLEKRNAD